jgi:AcrR family transcriptional regulator
MCRIIAVRRILTDNCPLVNQFPCRVLLNLLKACLKKGDDSKVAERQSGPADKYCFSKRGERKDAVQSRCRILEVARKLFGECGVDSVSMHQIAKSAQVGQGTLYRRYAHKGELCLDLLKESAEAFLQETQLWIAESEDSLSDLNVLENVIIRIVDFTDAKVDLLAEINHSKFIGENVFYSHLHEIVSTLLGKIIEKNVASAVDASLAADILLSAMSPEVYMFERYSRGYSKEQIISGIRRIYILGLIR